MSIVVMLIFKQMERTLFPSAVRYESLGFDDQRLLLHCAEERYGQDRGPLLRSGQSAVSEIGSCAGGE